VAKEALVAGAVPKLGARDALSRHLKLLSRFSRERGDPPRSGGG
jgi:hypothetical protein